MGMTTRETTLKVTPGRKTRFRLDPPITALQSPACGLTRTGTEIARGGTEEYGTEAVYQLATGAWGLLSVQVEGSAHTERTDNHNSNPNPADYDLASDVVFHNRQATPTNLPGLAFTSIAAPSSNGMFVKSPKAGQSWSNPLPSPPYSVGPVGNFTLLLEAILASKAAFAPDTHYQFSFEVPGTAVNQRGAFLQIHFGGATLPNGSGLYSLIFFGNGVCELWEYIAPGGTVTPVKRDAWQFSEPNRVVGTHRMLIHPHRNPQGGGYIQFTCNVTDAASSFSLITAFHVSPSLPTSHVYRIPNFLTPNSGQTRRNVTGEGKIQISARPDVRTWVQPSALKYLGPGTLVDWPFGIPFAVGSPPYLTINWNATIPDGCSIVGKLYDANTNAELTLASTTANSRTYRINPGQPYYYAIFTLTSDSTNSKTPLLWEYTVSYDAIYTTVAPGETQILNTNATGHIQSIGLTGPEKDPTHETGKLHIESPAGPITILDNRANIPFILDTTYDPTDPTKRSILQQGWIVRADATEKGGEAVQGMSGKVAGQTGTVARPFPAPDWTAYDVTMLGEWLRLQKAKCPIRINLLASGLVDENGVMLAHKVTDIVRAMIGYAGYAPDQIDVPDNDRRFFAGTNSSADQLMIEPLAPIGDWIVTNLHRYLGWFLVWDANAGTRGMWRVRPPTLPNEDGTYTPLLVLHLNRPGPNKAAFKSGTWNGKGDLLTPGPYVGDPAHKTTPVHAFVKKRTFHKWVRPMEGNAVHVTGLGDLLSGGEGQFRKSQWAVNVKSFNLPGANSADPTHPDYMPFFDVITDYDPSLSDQESIDLLTRRIYDVGCHSVKCSGAVAPLCLIWDPNDPHQTAPRPPRYYDPVRVISRTGVASDWLVRNCNLQIDKSDFQWMNLELEAPRESIS